MAKYLQRYVLFFIMVFSAFSIANIPNTFSLTNAKKVVSINRINGKDRYETSIEASKYGWANGSDNLILSTGEDFPDSECATTLSIKLKAPLLLIKGNTIDDKIKAEISRLKVKNIYIIGGLAILSQEIENSLKAMNISVNRISGNNKYETAFKVAQAIGQLNSIFIVSGSNFSDALSIAPVVGREGAAMLFADNDNLSADEYNYIKGVKRLYVIGGDKVLSDKLLENFSNSHRISGSNRYDTNINIINYFMDELNLNTSYFATGENFPDALSGAELAGISGSPLILSENIMCENTKQFIKSNNFLIDNAIVLGGENVLPTSQFLALDYNKPPNAENSINLTTYEGSGQGCHPKVLYFKDYWNGWKYWMVFTPYANSDDLTENPSILASNDGKTWTVPKGLIEPVINGLGISGIHYSDTHFLFNPDTNQIEMWYRYTAYNKLDIIYRSVSNNGISWSKPQSMISSLDGAMILSPAILYEKNKYKMWYVSYINYKLKCEYIESSDGINWSKSTEVNLNLSDSYLPWHLDVIHSENGYELLLDSFKSGEIKLNNRVLMWGVSNDGLSYNNITTILKPTLGNDMWDNQQIYRSTFVKVNGIYELYYSAMDKKNRWHIGLTQGKDLLNLHGYN